LMAAHPNAFALIARPFAASALSAGQGARALDELQQLYRQVPSLDVLAAIGMIDPDAAAQRRRIAEHLTRQPGLSAAHELLALRTAGRGQADDEDERIAAAIAQAA